MSEQRGETATREGRDDLQVVRSSAPADDATAGLPGPDAFERYEKVLPGAADRILKMMEHQADHRMAMETSLVESAVRTERLGQLSGLAVVALAFVVSALLIVNGHPVSGTILGVADLVGLVAVFASRGDRVED